MRLFGLTGGIASGKSAVTTVLREAGVTVMDLDVIARDVVKLGTPGLAQVLEMFGHEYANPDGTLNRKKLGNLVFNDTEELTRLSALMDPLMWKEVERQRAALADELAFLDAALLIEKKMHEHMDGTVLVIAPLAVRIRRAMERDSATEAQVRARVNTQMDDNEKRKHADFVIENDGTVHELYERVMALLETLREPV